MTNQRTPHAAFANQACSDGQRSTGSRLCLLRERVFRNEGKVVLGNRLAGQLCVVGTEHEDALATIQEGIDVGDADAGLAEEFDDIGRTAGLLSSCRAKTSEMATAMPAFFSSSQARRGSAQTMRRIPYSAVSAMVEAIIWMFASFRAWRTLTSVPERFSMKMES